MVPRSLYSSTGAFPVLYHGGIPRCVLQGGSRISSPTDAHFFPHSVRGPTVCIFTIFRNFLVPMGIAEKTQLPSSSFFRNDCLRFAVKYVPKMKQSLIAPAIIACCTAIVAAAADSAIIRSVTNVHGSFNAGGQYTANRNPLQPSPFVKLPIGSIQPGGWLRQQLEIERDGMIGRLAEISPWLNFERSAWGNKEGQGERGWEELPYWLKGYGDLGYVLKDEHVIAEAKRWIESAIASQREDGWFGPRALLTSLNGKPDLWPNMVMLNILQSWHEYSGDKRVPDLMTRYFRWEDQLPATAFGEGYWPKIRAGDNIESIYWLYNRTGESWLLPLAQKIHDHMARWDDGVINWHNVNIAQGFREPGVFFMQSHDSRHLAQADRNYLTVMGRYGQFPGGGFGGDENCRPGYYDPRQGFETCGIVEFMHSFEMLTKISGSALWSDRCEDLAFNSLPAAMTPDQKGLHYLTCANQIQLDKNNKAPAIENGGTMFSYSPFEVYRCCQHNVSHGWPYYAEELWLGTSDGGLCASLFAESTVTAKVSGGASVTIVENTGYPFSDTIKLKLRTGQPVRFPLYLRIPGWCADASIRVNGKKSSTKFHSLGYAVVEREWKNDDELVLTLPMTVKIQRWEKNANAASVSYGPLSFSLQIKEDWKRYGRNAKWPEWEVFPASPWNYGLVLDEKNAAKGFDVREHKLTKANPFVADSAPVTIKAKARKITNWKADRFNMVGKLQPSPILSNEKTETVTLIPMGAARLRITSFPVIGSAPDAHEWQETKASPIQASHLHSGDSVEAVNDGIEPTSSADRAIPRFTWWDHRGSREWIDWGFPQVRKVSSVSVYWFDDTGRGSCRPPASWRVLYRVGEQWKAVETTGEPGVQLNRYNRVTFNPVECNGVRIEAQLQPGFSAGILEWKVD